MESTNSSGQRSTRNSVSGIRPVPVKQLSILPSLSIANSHGSPTASPVPQLEMKRDRRVSTEEFFHEYAKDNKNPSDVFAENLNERLKPTFIQPKSTVKKLDGSVVDLKKVSDETGLPSVKVTSATNLAAMNSLVAPTASSSVGDLKKKLFTLNNSSASLIHEIKEEEEGEEEEESDAEIDEVKDWDNDFNEMVNPRTKIKLAPFGGFSNPMLKQGILKSNVFETSPWKVLFAAKGNGSLIKAVKMAVEEDIIHTRRWVGTLAMPTDEVPEHVLSDISKTLSEEYFSTPIFPSDLTFSGHYKSFCKQMLWPTLHYEIPDNPKSKAFEDHSWGHYKALNQMMADKIVEVYQQENGHLDPEDPENMIWIHDYHLLLVPQMIREKLPDAKIGLFLHVSFPSSEVFRCLAQREALLKGMLGANCVSFQTEEYVRHFLQTCSRLLLADTNDYGMSYKGNFTMVNTIPVGIDANSLNELLTTDNVVSWRTKIRQRWGHQKLIVSRDKLDKLRGIKEKLLAYETFLKANPCYIDDTVLIQICIGSTSDDDYSTEVMQIVSRINSMAENISVSQPVVLLQQDITFDQYLALQIESDVFVVSSMREGLNLTCHEFIVATNERKSPLMLSEFTGSSHLLQGGAVLINPWDIRNFSKMFLKLLTMDPDEKIKRWRICHDVVTQHDYRSWIRGCLNSVNEAWKLSEERNAINVQPLKQSVLREFNNVGGKKLYFINLETASTVTNFGEFKSISNVPVSSKTLEIKNSDLIPPTHIVKLLNELLNDSNNKVYLCSYFKRLTLDTLFKRMPKLGLIAENGGYIKIIETNKWVSIVDEQEVMKWMPQVKQIVEAKVERLPGSKADVEDCTIIFNPGKSLIEDRARSMDLIGDLIQHVNDVFNKTDGAHASLIRNNVVVQQNQLNLRALNFLVNYYNNNSVKKFEPREIYDSPTSTPIKEKPSFDSSTDRLTGLFVSGGNTSIDEANYNFGNTLFDNGVVEKVLTVAALDNDSKSTSAKYEVRGRNELLGVLSKATKGEV